MQLFLRIENDGLFTKGKFECRDEFITIYI
jgi:hypothetical protein